MRVGHGYDVHKLVAHRKLVLGGVEIEHSTGLLGHSDADVVLHSVCDSMLGALGLGDIGHHFPDNDSRYKNIDSRELLRQVCSTMDEQNYSIANLDITIIAQAPRLAAHLPQMRINISEDLRVNTGQVNIKATTTEHLGFAGREEGIAAHAVVLLIENE
ncbi:MAG: 2-C-methyl-D-erythritol 2,4-cyclodiphosphate synthase [Arenicella sp.]|nr:2-C-methyl-D-erythritol 2,4-cyclodiphosphate synthase [Arenicella sp.]